MEIELGPKMLVCSERERKFVIAYLDNGCRDASDAARTAGYADPGPHSASVRVQAHVLMHRQRVIDALKEVGNKHFQGLFLPAVMAMETLIKKPDHPDHAKTVFSVLSRLGLTERTTMDVNLTGEVTVNHTDQALADLRALLALQVPRSKLEEVFGFSGLQRYEKMLAEADRGRGKLIEHGPSSG